MAVLVKPPVGGKAAPKRVTVPPPVTTVVSATPIGYVPPNETPWERQQRLAAQDLAARALGGGVTTETKTTPPVTPSKQPAINVPGYDPDYAALIAGDPTLIAGQGDASAYESQLSTARVNAIRRAVIAMGLNPGSTVGDIDQATLDAAASNPTSTAHTIEDQKTHSTTDLANLLAARGIYDSGALTGGQQRIQTSYDTSKSQATQSLLDQISGYEQDAADKTYQVQQQVSQLRQQAALRIMQDPRYQPLGASDAVLDPSSGLYVTPDGRWYNPDGSRAGTPSSNGGGSNDNPPPPPVTPPLRHVTVPGVNFL